VQGMYLALPSSLAKTEAPRADPSTSADRPSGARKSRATNSQKPSPRVELLGSGTILREALAAGNLLERDWNIAADVWSVTSFTELRRSALELERMNRLHPTKTPQLSWVERCLGPTEGPIVAATDYVRAVPDLIRTWVPRRYTTLGTDGFGRSDTRTALRRFFEVDSISIALAAITSLVEEGLASRSLISQFMSRYRMPT
jgi:pyruvate dehydrogenase E1 component